MPGGENWSVGFAVGAGVQALDSASLPQAATLAVARARTWITTGSSMAGPCTLLNATVQIVDSNGLVEAQASAAPATAAAGPAAQSVPHQITSVLTLQTATPGPRGRGRIYLPTLGATIGAGGRLTTTARDAALASIKTALKGTVDDFTPLFGSTAPFLAVSSSIGPALRPVTALRMGDVLDTQRRRRDKLPEAYASVSPTS